MCIHGEGLLRAGVESGADIWGATNLPRAQRLSDLPPALAEQIAGVKSQAIASGRDVIDLASDELDLPPSQALLEQFGRFVSDPATSGSAAAARAEFRQAVVRRFENRPGLSLDPENEVTEVSSRKAGLAYTFWTAVDPGDFLLIPELTEPWVKASILLAGGVPYELSENDGLPDPTAVPGDVVQKTALLYVNCSHNPAGAAATPAFFQDVVNFARETGTLILHAAAYSHIVYDGHRAPSILEANGAKDVALELHSLTTGLGWDMGFVIGNADAIRALNKVRSTVESPLPVALARTAAWALDNGISEETLATLTRRRDALVNGLNDPGWKVVKPKASPFVWLPVPPGQTSGAFAQALLEQADVLTLPGLAFGPQADGYVRLSLAVGEERLAEAARRIGRLDT